MHKEESRSAVGWLVGLVLLGVPAAYFGAYLLLLTPNVLYSEGLGWRFAWYRWGGKPATYFFHPAHLLDRQLRPGYWEGEDFSGMWKKF
jgi:hypothetical protein